MELTSGVGQSANAFFAPFFAEGEAAWSSGPSQIHLCGVNSLPQQSFGDSKFFGCPQRDTVGISQLQDHRIAIFGSTSIIIFEFRRHANSMPRLVFPVLIENYQWRSRFGAKCLEHQPIYVVAGIGSPSQPVLIRFTPRRFIKEGSVISSVVSQIVDSLGSVPSSLRNIPQLP